MVVTQHQLLTLEHSSVYPAKGAVARLCKTMFYVNEQPHPNWPCAIAVRALSPVEPPPDGLARLHSSAYLFAFLLAWAQAKNSGCSP